MTEGPYRPGKKRVKGTETPRGTFTSRMRIVPSQVMAAHNLRRLRHPRRGVHHRAMRVIATSNNPVRLSFLTALLADAGIATVLLDAHASVMDGSIGAIPRRLCVASDDHDRARRVLREAGEP